MSGFHHSASVCYSISDVSYPTLHHKIGLCWLVLANPRLLIPALDTCSKHVFTVFGVLVGLEVLPYTFDLRHIQLTVSL